MQHSATGKPQPFSPDRAHRSTLRRALEHPKELVFITDDSGVVQYINSACEVLTGYSALELVDSNLKLISAELPKCHSWESLRSKAVDKGIARGPTAIQCKDGSLLELDLAITIVLNPRTQAAMLACTGFTLAQQQQIVAGSTRSAGMDAIGQFTSGITHDFNNLLMVIGAYAEMGLVALPSEHSVRRNLQEIQASVRRASELTRRLLTFGRKSKGQQLVSLNWIIEDTAGMLARIMEEDIEIRVSLGKNVGLVRIDPGQIEEVLLNLAVNARDAMPNGGEFVIETQSVELDNSFVRQHPEISAGEHVLLTVTDSGHGMPPHELACIFEPFFTTKSEGKGTGLGLAMVHSIIQQSRGSVAAKSEPGIGTTFKIYLPVEARACKKPAASLHDETPPPRGHESLLIVEDAAPLRQSAAEFLSSLGYKVSLAANGAEALEILKRNREELALLVIDVIMPQMSGHEFARAVSSLQPQARVLFISGHAEDVVLRKGIHPEETDFLQKPFSLKSLAIKIRELLDQPAPMRLAAAAAGR